MKIVILFLISLFLFNIVKSQPNNQFITLNPEMHTAPIERISVDANGEEILTVSRDKTAKLWDARSGSLLKTIRLNINENNEGMLFSGALSPDGKIIALSGWTSNDGLNNSIYFFEVKTGDLVYQIPSLPNLVLDLEFSYDSKYLVATLGGNGGIRIYEIKNLNVINKKINLEVLKSFTNYYGSTYSAVWDKTGRLATACADGSIKLYSNDFKLIKEISNKENTPMSIAFSPEGDKIAVGYMNSKISVLDGYELKLIHEPETTGIIGQTQFNSIAFSPDGKYLVAGGNHLKSIANEIWWNIRMWTDQGRGAYFDYPAAKNCISDIKFIQSNVGNLSDFIYCSYAGDWGRMNIDGSKLFYKKSEANLYIATNNSHFKINNDGSQIAVTPFGGDPISFSLISRKISYYGNISGLNSYSDTRKGIIVSDWHNSKSPKINNESTNFMDHGDQSKCVDISQDAKKIVFGTNNSLYCTDVEGKVLWKKGLDCSVLSTNIAGNNQVLAATLSNGIIGWYNLSNGDHLLSLFLHPDNKRWVLWTPSGYFECSADAENLIGLHINQETSKVPLFFPISSIYENFYYPSLGASVLAGKEIKLTNTKIEDCKQPPIVKITSPNLNIAGFKSVDNILQSNKKNVIVTVEVTDKGGGIDEICLYHNKKLIDVTNRAFITLPKDGKKETKTFNLTLLNGINNIKATAFNVQRMESLSDEIDIIYNLPVQIKPNMYILAIGINEYLNPRYNLNYAKNDALAFVKALYAGASNIFESVIVSTLCDSEATRDGIISEIQKIQSMASPDDVFVFYYAGHGVMSSSNANEVPEFFLVPYNLTRMYEANEALKEKGISAEEIGKFSKNIHSQKQLFVLDACQSGGATQSFAMRGAAEEKAISQLSRSTGTYFLAASGTEQFATEVTSLGHGIFTYSILEAFKGACNSQNGRLTVNLLKSCVEDLVPELSQKYNGQPQFPTGYGFGQDFPILIVK